MKTSFIVPAVFAAVASVHAEEAGITAAQLLGGGQLLCAYAGALEATQSNVTIIEQNFFANPPTGDPGCAFASLSADSVLNAVGTCVNAVNATMTAVGGAELDLPEPDLATILIAVNTPVSDIIKSDLFYQLIKDYQCLLPSSLKDLLFGVRTQVVAGQSLPVILASAGLTEPGALDKLFESAPNCTEPVGTEEEYNGGHAQLLAQLFAPTTDEPTTEEPTPDRRLSAVVETVRRMMVEPEVEGPPIANKMLALALQLLGEIGGLSVFGDTYGAFRQSYALANGAENKTAVVETFVIATEESTFCPCAAYAGIPDAYGIDSVLMRYLNHDDFIPVWNKLFDALQAAVGSFTATAGSASFKQTCAAQPLAAGLGQALNVCKTAVTPLFGDIADLLFTDKCTLDNFCAAPARSFTPLFVAADYAASAAADQPTEDLDNVETLVRDLGDRVFGEVGGVLDFFSAECKRTVAPVTKEPTSSASTSATSVAGVAVAIAAVLLVRDN